MKRAATIRTPPRWTGCRVDSPVVCCNACGDSMCVTSNAENTNSLMADISTASAGQTSGLRQVEGSIQSLDATTQQNAALVEQTAAATLKDSALRLNQEMAYFVLP